MKNKLFVRILILMSCLLASVHVFGQDSITPQKKALIKELLSLMNTNNNAETITRQFQQQMKEPMVQLFSQELSKVIAAEKLAPSERRRIENNINQASQRAFDHFQAEMAKRINFSDLLEQVWLGVYDKHFTDEELKELIAFYKSPVGGKIINLLPQMMGEMFPKLQELISPVIIETMGEILENEKKNLLKRQN